MSAIQVFAFDSAAVRTIMIDGEPWFVAKDVAEILGYSETEKMTRRLDEDEIQKIASPELGGANSMAREFTIINESGLYASVLGSNKPEAKTFKKWVTSELLPSIRKHGAYALDGSHTQTVDLPHRVMPYQLNHRADVMVSADRAFRSVLRSCKSAGMSEDAAIIRACEETLYQTGIDMTKVLNLDVGSLNRRQSRSSFVDGFENKQTAKDFLINFLLDWQSGSLPIPFALCKSWDLYLAYEHWCNENQYVPVHNNHFPRIVTETLGIGVLYKRLHMKFDNNKDVSYPCFIVDSSRNHSKNSRDVAAMVESFQAFLYDWIGENRQAA